MAEKVVLEAEVKSNIGKQVKETEEWGKSLDQVNEELKLQNKWILDQETELVKLKAKQDSIPKGAWWAGAAKLNERIRETTSALKVEKQALKGLKAEQKEAADKVKAFNKAQADQKKLMEETFGSFKIFGLTLQGVKKAFGRIIPTAKLMFSSVKAGLISTGIGAFVVLLGSLATYFTNSKKGADVLSTAMAGLGAAVKVITDLFAKVGEAAVGAFTNPKEAISDLWDFIKKNLMNRLTGLVDGFKGAMKIIESAIKLDWDGVKEGAEDYGRALVQVGTGLDVEQQKKFAQGIKDVVTEIKEEVKVMTELERGLQRVRDAENAFLVEKAKTKKAVAQAKLDSKDETKTLEERRAALQSALDMQQETTDKELQLAKRKMAIQQQQMATSTNMAEDEKKLAELQADVYNKETASLLQQRRLKSEMNTFDKQIAAEKQAILDAEDAAWEKKMEENDAWNIKMQEEAQMLLELQQQNTLDLIEDLAERAREELRIQEEKELASVEGMENAEAMKEEIRKKYDIKNKKLDDKVKKNKEKDDKALMKMKIGFATDTLGAIASIAGEETKVGKAAAIAQATVSGAQSVMNAFNTASLSPLNAVIPGYNFVQAGLAAAFAVKQIKDIASSKPPTGGGGGGGGGDMAAISPDSGPAPQMMSGAFELGGGTEPEPTRAYVVTDDMTDSQNQLANIRRRATI